MPRDTFYQWVPRERLLRELQDVPTPAYLFFPEVIRDRIDRLRRCVGRRFQLHYAVKANPHPDILRFMALAGLGADVASAGELHAVLAAGIAPGSVEFSGPGKRPEELRAAIDAGIGAINAESLDEIRLLDRLAGEFGRRVPVGIRINPELEREAGGIRMAGATQFGMDESEMANALSLIRAAENRLAFSGIHVHVGSQVLEEAAVLDAIEGILGLALRAEAAAGMPLRKINFGGGWGVPYYPGQSALDLELIAEELADLLADSEYRDLIRRCRLMLEPGRFLVAEAGVFCTRVRYRKRVRGREIAVVDGGMHQNYLLVGGMGQVVRRNFAAEVIPDPEAPPPEPMKLELDVAGPLCTPQDRLAEALAVDHAARPGDFVVFFTCGAYGRSASPVGFLSHPAVAEVMVAEEDGRR